MILAGDVGATKALLGLFERRAGGAEPVREAVLPTASHASAEALLAEFAGSDRPRIRQISLGVAGPVAGTVAGRVNLPWKVEARKVSRAFAGAPVELLNDVEALAYGLSVVPASRMRNLTPRRRRRAGDAALLAVGTGLGMCRLQGERYLPLVGEGGHQGFAPRSDLDVALYRTLKRRFGRVSLERVISGTGIGLLYGFLLENGWSETYPTDVRAIDGAPDRNAAICAAALGGDRLAGRALAWFAELCGAAAGDLALASNAVGGVFLGGGVPVKLLPFLQNEEFVAAFDDKGRLRSVVDKIPVRVILEPRTALLGAAAHAAARRAVRSPARRRASKK